MKPDTQKHKLYESALIKSIRRGNQIKAVAFAGALCLLGKSDIVWRRIFIHLSEDVGLANEGLPAQIHALYQSYLFLKSGAQASYEDSKTDYLPIAHAVLLLAQSPKSRAVENALICEFTDASWSNPEIPDCAIDCHSPKGRRMGRGAKHFIEEAGKIVNVGAYEDLWRHRAEGIMLAAHKS